MDQFVKACVKVASDLCFDGWLVNIENKLSPDQIPLMILLLRRLTGKYIVGSQGASQLGGTF